MSEKPVQAPDKTGVVHVENGTRQIYWEYFGKGEHEVVVLLNGVGMMTKIVIASSQTFIPTLIRLTEAQNPFFENIDADPDAYRYIQTSTLIVTGDQDRAIPPWQQGKLLKILPNCRQVRCPGSGHLTYQERPDIFRRQINSF